MGPGFVSPDDFIDRIEILDIVSLIWSTFLPGTITLCKSCNTLAWPWLVSIVFNVAECLSLESVVKLIACTVKDLL